MVTNTAKKYFFYKDFFFCILWLFLQRIRVVFKGAVTDMRYFAKSKFSRSLVHKKKF